VNVSNHVTAAESAFLDMERAGLPIQVAALLLLAGDRPVTMSEVHDLLVSRIERLPRFRQRPEGRDWVRVSRIDMRRHLLHHVLPAPGTMPQLLELCAHIHELELPRDRPLWQVHLIDGLHGDEQAILMKIHHAVCDGIAAVEVAHTLFDHGTKQAQAPHTTFAERRPSSVLVPLQILLGAAMTAAGGPIALAGPFNGRVGPRRDFAVTDIPLAVVRQAKHQY